MCGIAGIANSPARTGDFSDERQAAALAALAHRGPDARGEWSDEQVWLGHRRLSILDLSAAGNQPMQSPDGRFVLSYNGEVYNFRELAKEFALDSLRSRADSEVVLRLFAEQGIESLARLNGLFAFALYDRERRKLWLVRDRLGIKPLYYRLERDRLVFASEIKGLLALDSGAQNCNFAALHEWLYYGNALGDRTLYEGIQQLLPGHYLEIDLDSFRHAMCSYWTLAEQAMRQIGDNRTLATRKTRELLERAVVRQLVSDVPVGIFLSGGVDSSAITAFASRHYKGRLATYAVGFDFKRGESELPMARRVAARFGTEHHEIHIEGAIVGGLIEDLVHSHDMPFSDAANIPLQLMASRISGHTKVVLQGDGGDELFGGYRRYTTLTHHRALHWLARAALPLNFLLPETRLRYRAARYLRAFAADDVGSTIARLLSAEDRAMDPVAIFGPEIRAEVEKYDPFSHHEMHHRRFAGHDLRNRLSLVDLAVTLPDTFLEKVDRSTMAASLEVRVPFLDHELVDYVIRLPGHVKMAWGRKKSLLKAALEGIVPDEVLRAPKVGLKVPYTEWLQGALKPLFFDHLSRFERRHPGIVDSDHVKSIFALTDAGRRSHGPLLWKVLNFMIWANNSNIRFKGTEKAA